MRFRYLASRTFKEIYRDAITIILGMLMPISLLFLFSTIMSDDSYDTFSPVNLTPGIIIFSFAFITMFSALLLAKDRERSFLTRLMTSPLQPKDYVLAYTLPYIPIGFAQIIVCYITGMIIGFPFSIYIFTSLIIFIPAMLVSIGLGLVLGVLLTENQVSAAGAFVLVIASLFSGAWMDLDMIGGVFKRVGYLLPYAHAVEASRSILAGNPISDSLTGILVNCGYAAFFLILGGLIFKYRMKR